MTTNNNHASFKLSQVKRIVVKVGTSLIAPHTGIDEETIAHLSHDIVTLKKADKEVLLVSSGAVGAGLTKLGLTMRPKTLPELQAAASIGQAALMHTYEKIFAETNNLVAQVLLTHDDLQNRKRYLNAKATLEQLLAWGIVPIINENDVVVSDEIRFGDNDTLAALVVNLVVADLLVILTDQEGLYTADPRLDSQALLVQEALATDPKLKGMAGGPGHAFSRGGMLTKILAAERAARSGARTIICSGKTKNVLSLLLLENRPMGTLLQAHLPLQAARKRWLADQLKPKGKVWVDRGAELALQSGASLLPVGVHKIEGQFERGDLIVCVNDDHQEIGRGLTNYSAEEARRIIGKSSHKIIEILGYSEGEELIHRDNFTLLSS